MRYVSVYAVAETRSGRLVHTRKTFPEGIGLHNDMPALEGFVRLELERFAAERDDELTGELSIVLDRGNLLTRDEYEADGP